MRSGCSSLQKECVSAGYCHGVNRMRKKLKRSDTESAVSGECFGWAERNSNKTMIEVSTLSQ